MNCIDDNCGVTCLYTGFVDPHPGLGGIKYRVLDGGKMVKVESQK